MTSPGPYRAELNRAIGGLTVTRENVLVVRDAIVTAVPPVPVPPSKVALNGLSASFFDILHPDLRSRT